MSSYELEKEKIAQKMAKLERKEKIIRKKEQKFRHKQLIQLGTLINKANISHLDPETLMGAFLEIKDLATKKDQIEKWKSKGLSSLAVERETNPQPLIISLESELPIEIKAELRQKKFRWNPFRREWYGYGKKEDLESFLKGYKPHVEIATS